ncbi:MAG: hypothetical protein PHH82_04680 [Candidatus ainarchaeum sp.]|nr:hypothetical protein [Candidatus ainarchaeum sp.]
MDFQNFVQEMVTLKKAEKYGEILQFFKINKEPFTQMQITQHNYLVSIILTALRKTNNTQAVPKFLEMYNIVMNENTHEMVLNAYGWAIFDKLKEDVQSKQFNKYQFLSLVQTIIPLLIGKKSQYSYSIISNIFRLTFKSEKEKVNQDYKFIHEFCNIFNPDLLSKDVSTIEIKGQNKEMASDEENWYQHQTKALLELGKYQECFEISSNAIEKLHNFHYNNDLWFARRIALSKKALGDMQGAIDGLEKIFRKKKEWFIKKELAELYFEIGDIQKSFEYAIEAINMNGFGKIEMKIGIISLIAKILKTKKQNDLSYKHLLLVKTIKEQNGWQVTNNDLCELHSLVVENEEVDMTKLLGELKTYWHSFVPNKTPTTTNEVLTGTITKIINDNERGKDGWMHSNNKDYYFSVPSIINFIENININTQVLFKLKENQNNGKIMAKIIKVIN